MSLTEIVKGCPLFYDLYDKEVEQILTRCLVLSFEKGENVITQGEEGEEIFIVLSGELEVRKVIDDGFIPLIKLHGGDLFGELVLINKTMRTADVVTTQKSDILVLEYDKIFSMYEKDTKIFALLLLNLARLLTERLDNTNKLLEKLKKEKVEK